MQIIFAGTPIATGPFEGGTDAIEGFLPKRKANTQVAQPIRSTDVRVRSRANRKRTITGTITPKAFDDLGTAAQELFMFMDSYPDEGPLVIRVGTKQTTFANAVLDSVDPIKRQGVTIAVSLTFITGAGQPSNLPIATEAGQIFKTEDGKIIVNE